MHKMRTLHRNPSTRKLLIRVAIVVATVYAIFGCSVWWAMHQTPETFGRFMTHMPEPVAFLIFPFETAWTQARAGTLHIGDAAPDFTLTKLDKTASIRLSSFADQHRPVVLIFGSYT
jgi:hypothetical protein